MQTNLLNSYHQNMDANNDFYMSCIHIIITHEFILLHRYRCCPCCCCLLLLLVMLSVRGGWKVAGVDVGDRSKERKKEIGDGAQEGRIEHNRRRRKETRWRGRK